MKPSSALRHFLIASAILGTASQLHAQTVRTWTGTSAGAWLTGSNWGGTWAGEAPLANPAGEGLATDIMTTGAANTATNIGINMNSLAAAGSVGLILGGIDLNRSAANNLQIGNNSTAANGILQLNGATINTVDKTLIRVAGSGNLTIANVNTGTGAQTMGLRLGITDGIFTVGTGRILTISSNITQAAADSGFTKTGPGTMVVSGTNSYTGGATISGGTLQFSNIAAMPATGTIAVQNGATLAVGLGGTGQFTTGTSGAGTIGGLLAGIGGQGSPITYAGAVNLGFEVINTNPEQEYSAGISDVATSLGIVKLGNGTLTLSGPNTYTGVTTHNAGTLIVTGDQTAANGGWSIGGGGTVRFEVGSKIHIGAGKSVVFANGGGAGTRTLNVFGTVTTESDSSLQIRGRNVVNMESGSTWTQGGSLIIQPANSGFGAVLNVKTGSSFTYSGTSDIVLAEDSANNAGGASLNLSGGTFTTGRGFSNLTAGTATNTTATTNFNFSEGGTLKLTADIASLIIEKDAVTSPFNVTTGTGGGVIHTNGFSTAVNVGISGAGGLTKSGLGTLTLGATNTYAGDTLVSAGSLLVNGALGGGAVTVDPAASVGGTGSLGGSLSLTGTSFFQVVDLADPLAVTGTVTFGSGFGIANLLGVNWDSVALETPYTVIATSQSFDSSSIANFGRENAVAVGTDRQAYFTSGSLNLVVIPEPSTALLGGLGLLALLRRRRA